MLYEVLTRMMIGWAMDTLPQTQEPAPSPETVAQIRDTLLRRLVDLATLPIGRITAQERSLVDSVLAPTVSRLDLVSREKLSKRLAVQPEGPRQLVFALAQDEFSVAEPLLLDSQTLQSADLIHIIRLPAPKHRQAIASRRHLPTDAADALAESDDVEAVCRLLSNMNTRISAQAMEGLVRRSAEHHAYQPLLLERPELTVRLAQLMFWWALPAHRFEILRNYTTERRTIHDTLADVIEPALAVAQRDDALSSVLAMVRLPAAGNKNILRRLLSFVPREGDVDFARELADFARIRTQTASRIITDAGGEPLAMLAKALLLTRSEFVDLWSVTAHFRGLGESSTAKREWVCSVFDAVSTDRADFALHSWDFAMASESDVPIFDLDQE